MVERNVRVLLVGIGGYGRGYVERLLGGNLAVPAVIAGVADPMAERSPAYPLVERLGVPVTGSVEEFFEQGEADAAVISSPIHFHREHVEACCRGARSVLCEKPVGALVADGLAMIRARDENGCWLGIGYQWSFSREMRELKRDVLKGLFGAPRRFKTLVLWPRSGAYYRRADWAGRVRLGDRWVLDSPVNNACAHYLHNMFYILGPDEFSSTAPVSLRAELYRANPIENYDTAAVRVRTETGVDLLFLVSHAVRTAFGPVFHYEFEHAVVSNESGPIAARFRDGRRKEYGIPDGSVGPKLEAVLLAAAGGEDAEPPACGVEAALPQTMCVEGIRRSVRVEEFPSEMVKEDGPEEDRLRWVEGLAEEFAKCYAEWSLPSERGCCWSVPGPDVPLPGFGAVTPDERERGAGSPG